MSLDKHFNEHGGLPSQLEDDEPTDMPATLGIVAMIAIVAAIGLGVLALFQTLG